MEPRSNDAISPSVSEIVIRTLRGLPVETKRGVRLVLIAWAIVLIVQVWDSSHRPGPRGIAELASVVLGTAGVLLVGLAEALRRAEGSGNRAAPVRQILMALPTLASLACVLLGSAVAILVARVWLGTSPIILVIAVLYVVALIGAVLVVKNASAALYEFGQREAARVASAEAQLAQARLAALQAQMNPHFLFNALNTVAALVSHDPSAAEATVLNLSNVLRMTLERSQGSTETVAEEVSFVRAYLAIEQQRLGDRVSVDWSVSPEAEAAMLPPLIIQPLVENAIKHGIGPRRRGGRIGIAVTRYAERLIISVSDDGEGFAARYREGTGLGNLRKRLAVAFGVGAGVEVKSASTGAQVIVDLPFQTGPAADARTDR